MQFISKILPEQSALEVSEQLLMVQDRLWHLGITGVHDFDGWRCLDALHLLQESGKLGLKRLVKLMEQGTTQFIQLQHRAQSLAQAKKCLSIVIPALVEIPFYEFLDPLLHGGKQ